MSNKKWAEANLGYWKEYRKKNPEKAERNRILQTIRKRRRSKKKQGVDTSLIAKVDTSMSNKVKVVGEFWMVPVIAKVDSLKSRFYIRPTICNQEAFIHVFQHAQKLGPRGGESENVRLNADPY